MSNVELAIKKVKKLSPNEVQQLLTWLDARQVANSVEKASRGRRPKRPRTMAELKAWRKSIQLATDWQPPRMPNDLAKPFVL